MKHGDKAKSKAASKASGKKSSKASAKSSKASTKSGKAGAKSSKASPVKSQKHHAAKEVRQASGGSTRSHPPAGNGKPGRTPADNAGFTNPTVAAAFKRAVKKYSNAFRRLTD